jgi:hypothetical protein
MRASLIAHFVVQHLHPIPFPSIAEITSNRSRASNPLNALMLWAKATLLFPLHRKSPKKYVNGRQTTVYANGIANQEPSKWKQRHKTPSFAQNNPFSVSRNQHTAVCSCLFQSIYIPFFLHLFMIQAIRNRLSVFELRTLRSKSRSLRTSLPFFSKRLSYGMKNQRIGV